MSENVGASTSRNPKGLHGDNFTFTCITIIVNAILKYVVKELEYSLSIYIHTYTYTYSWFSADLGWRSKSIVR
jgi:hypothetical protein